MSKLRALLAAALVAGATSSFATSQTEGLTLPDPRVVETTFESVDATVAAQWEFPERTPAPLVMIIPHSSGIDRNGLPPGDESDPESGIYAQLARALVREGFAVFRFDGPGSGRSSRGRYCTARSTALEAYTRAVDHARVDTQHVYLLGHSMGTDTIAGIYTRYTQINPIAGVILLSNRVGETDIVGVTSPALIVVSESNPDDHFQHGQFVADARQRFTGGKLETELVTIPEADHSLVTVVEEPQGKHFSFHPQAVRAIVDWLRKSVSAGGLVS